MSSSFEAARQSEEKYHQQFYEENKLFESGSWIANPTPLAMELLDKLLQYTPEPVVLDLACGVGRHAIPIAQKLEQGGKVVAVDLLEDAIQQLNEYAKEYNVSSRIQSTVHDVEHYSIEPNQYDYMIATGCLEHLSSEQAFRDILEQMKQGTRIGGIHFISMASSVEQVDQQDGTKEKGNIELNLSTEQLLAILDQAYEDWHVIARKTVTQAIEENKDEKDIELQGNWVTFAVSKEPEQHDPTILRQVDQTGYNG